VTAAPTRIEGSSAYFEYFTGETLDGRYQKEMSDVDTVLAHIKEDVDRIYDYTPEFTTEFVMTPEFEEVFGNGGSLVGEPATLAANVDLAFDNIMIQDGQWILIDYEWVLKFPVPIIFLKYRSLIYFWNRHSVHLISHYSKEEFLLKNGMDPKYTDLFDEMEENFQKFVRGKDFEYQVLRKHEKTIISFEQYKGLVDDLQARDATITYLNDLIENKNEYIKGLEALIKKFHSNPAYKVYNAGKQAVRALTGKK